MKKWTRHHSLILVCVIFILATIIEIVCGSHHGEVIWERLPGADAVIGFIGGWILLLFAKKIIAPLLQKDEDYYGEHDD